MATDKTAVRFPWVALALSFLSSGVGHIYCGRIAKGLVFYSAKILLPLACLLAAFAQPSNGVFLGLILAPMAATALIFFYAAFDAHAIAKRIGPDYQLKQFNRTSLYWALILAQLAILVVLTWGIREHAYEAFVIPTSSMSPNILVGDRILVNKRPFRDGFPKRGDLVVFRAPPLEPSQAWIKRVIGVAGDEIVINGRNVEVNGQELKRTATENVAAMSKQIKGQVHYESHAGRSYRVLAGNDAPRSNMNEIKVTVPERRIFVMGDNRDRSRDSREFGSIDVGNIIGCVDYIYFPAETWSRLGVYRD